MRKVILILICGLLMSSITYGQTYTKLSDAVGLSATSLEMDSLEEQSLLLSEEFDINLDETNYIKVYDYGYYLHSPLYGETLDEELLAIKNTIASTQPNYLLFAKRINADGILDKLSVELVFDSDPYSCLDTENINYYLQKISNEKIEEYQDNSIYELEILILKEANRIISSGFCCSFYNAGLKDDKAGSNSRNEVCVDFEKVEMAYDSLKKDNKFIEYYLKIVPTIKAYVLEFLGCPSELQKPFGRNGLIPYCVWKDSPIVFFIPVPPIGGDHDIPFECGIIDGIYSDFIDLGDLVLALPEIEKNLKAMSYDYLFYYLFCETGIDLNKTEGILLIEKLGTPGTFEDPIQDNILVDFFSKMVDSAKGFIKKKKDEKCEEKIKTYNTINTFLEFATNKDSIQNFATELYSKMDTTLSNLNISDEKDRYYVGYYGIKVLMAFYGGVKAVGNIAKKGLSKLSKLNLNQKKTLGRETAKKVAKTVLGRVMKKQWFKNMDNTAQNQFIADFGEDLGKLKYFEGSPNAGKAWGKVFKESDVVSKVLRKDIPTLEWLAKHGDDIPQSAADDLLTNLNGKTVKESFEDGQGRLVVITESSTPTKVASTIEKTVSGEFKSFKHSKAYNKHTQPGKPPLSANKLTPDFSGNPNWLFPISGNQKNIVKIKLTGKRNGVGGDFDLCNKAANLEDLIPPGKWKPDNYTWHHMDDFDPITGESILQLVKTTDHVGTIPHVGSAKQWSNYHGIEYK